MKSTLQYPPPSIEGRRSASQGAGVPMTTRRQVDGGSFPRGGLLEDQFAFLLRYAILAPSTHNTQPWKFALTHDGIDIFADYSRRMPAADPNNRELLMSVGAAIFNLRVAASHFGFEHCVEYTYGGDSERPLARVWLTPALPHHRPDPLVEALFPAIVNRHTNRNPFLLARIPVSVLQQLQYLGERSRVSLFISTGGTINRGVADLVEAADRQRLADPLIRGNLAEWMRPNWTSRPDGMTGAAFGMGAVASALGAWTTRVLDLSRVRAAHERSLCVEAPGLIVLCSDDAVALYLETGELLERLLLTLVREGLHCSYFNMPVHVPEFRAEIRRMLGLTSWPQLLLRIGYCLDEPAPTPRRPINDVIMKRLDV